MPWGLGCFQADPRFSWWEWKWGPSESFCPGCKVSRSEARGLGLVEDNRKSSAWLHVAPHEARPRPSEGLALQPGLPIGEYTPPS